MKITSFLSKSTDQPSDSVEPLNPMEGNLLPGLGDDAAPEQDADATAKPHPSGLQFSGFFEMEIWIG